MEILFFRGKGLINSLVRWQTNSPYAHVAIRISDKADLIIESTPKHGVRYRSIQAHEWAAGGIDRFKCMVDIESTPGFTDLIRFAEAQIGKKYDFQGIFRFLTRAKGTEPERWFCSELVFASFLAAGLHLLAVDEAWRVTPGALSWSPLLKKIT